MSKLPVLYGKKIQEKNKEIEGILFKGVAPNYDSSNLKPFLIAGKWLNFADTSYSKQIIVSQPIASELQLNGA